MLKSQVRLDLGSLKFLRSVKNVYKTTVNINNKIIIQKCKFTFNNNTLHFVLRIHKKNNFPMMSLISLSVVNKL